MTFQLHVLNPGKKRRGAKKGGKKRAAKKTARKARAHRPAKKAMAKKRSTKRKRNPSAKRVYHAVRRRVRRAAKAVKKHVRRRRRNPGARAMLGGLKKGLPSLREVGGAAIGIIATGIATKYFADGTPIFAGSGPSSLAGEPWNAKQYLAAAGVATVGAQIANKILPGSGHMVTMATVVLGVAKTVLPLVGKSPTLAKYLGEADGEVRVDEDGQSWVMQGGRWNALQGLVNATPMDGYMGGLVNATPLDAVDDDYGITTSHISVNG